MHRLLILAAVTLIALPITSLSQTRTRRTAAGATQKSSTSSAQTAEIRLAGANKVADQIKILTKFLYLLGGATKGIEQIDEAARKNEASPDALKLNDRSKESVKSSLRNVREGLDALETYFNSTPGLKSYYLKLAGSAEGAANAENLAAAGQFDRAGRSLLEVVNRLTDTLAIMR